MNELVEQLDAFLKGFKLVAPLDFNFLGRINQIPINYTLGDENKNK